MMVKRDVRLDVVKGFCILLMVWGHLPRMGECKDFLEETVRWIYCFHMPIFALITGYLFGGKSGAPRDAVQVVNRMLKPYLVGAVLMLTMYYFSAQMGVGTSVGVPARNIAEGFKCIVQGRCGGALWYLYSFGLVEILVIGMLRILQREEKSFDCTFGLLVLVVGTCIVLRDVFGCAVRVSLLPYFFFGFFVRRVGMTLPATYLSIVPIVLFVLCRAYFSNEMLEYAKFVFALSVFALLMRLATSKASVLSGGAMTILSFCGRHTLSILLFHSIFSVAIRGFTPYVLKIEPSGIFLNFFLLVAVVACCLFAEIILKKTFAKTLIY